MSFRAATYNVLATAYINPQWYKGVPAELLRPERRLPALVRHVEELEADLLCLQEVEDETFAALQRHLTRLGYQGLYEKKGRGKPDGCATFFRTARFTPRGIGRLDYHDAGRPTEDNSGHIALLLGLEHEGHLLGVANTHLRWDRPGTPRAEQVGYRQAVALLEACRAFTPRCQAWLLCGDFNRTPEDEVVAMLCAAGFEPAHVTLPQALSCVANGKASVIDYLFHTRQLWARPIAPPALRGDTPLPSAEEPSDHVALVAEFDWV
jgi:mRNA deadenylase 3'-5' endonuclease subunit Ccr4